MEAEGRAAMEELCANARPATGQNCSRSEKFTLGIVLVPTHSIHFAFVGPARLAPCRCAESKSCHRHPKIIVTPLQAVPMTVAISVALLFQQTRSWILRSLD